ncbi:hypothetical protein PsAD2_03992 [Pseudovibrio axinellae]|uniref:Uncharacterized protein n=1 Tax=Pseudovibrio axinellae TaxID=989403 RepID=A0A165U9M2_9HYPH|nr:hypothetical protein PsAD2_03992 [Pseudovibrio axinellae]
MLRTATLQLMLSSRNSRERANGAVLPEYRTLSNCVRLFTRQAQMTAGQRFLESLLRWKSTVSAMAKYVYCMKCEDAIRRRSLTVCCVACAKAAISSTVPTMFLRALGFPLRTTHCSGSPLKKQAATTIAPRPLLQCWDQRLLVG